MLKKASVLVLVLCLLTVGATPVQAKDYPVYGLLEFRNHIEPEAKLIKSEHGLSVYAYRNAAPTESQVNTLFQVWSKLPDAVKQTRYNKPVRVYFVPDPATDPNCRARGRYLELGAFLGLGDIILYPSAIDGTYNLAYVFLHELGHMFDEAIEDSSESLDYFIAMFDDLQIDVLRGKLNKSPYESPLKLNKMLSEDFADAFASYAGLYWGIKEVAPPDEFLCERERKAYQHRFVFIEKLVNKAEEKQKEGKEGDA